MPKDGSRLDLPIALGILIASGQLPENCTEDFEFIGELALDGHVRPVSGALTLAMACQQAQHKIVLPSIIAKILAIYLILSVIRLII